MSFKQNYNKISIIFRYKCLSNGHPLCRQCNDFCECGSEVGETPCKITSKLLEILQINSCRNQKHGCQEVCERSQLNNHERNCEYRIIHCPDFNCREKVTFLHFMDHFRKCHETDLRTRSQFKSIGEKKYSIKVRAIL